MNTDKRWPRTDSKRTTRYEKKKVYANIRNDEKYILICRRESKKPTIISSRQLYVQMYTKL
jgi:hypothetical protein